jgi:hypothetical protein
MHLRNIVASNTTTNVVKPLFREWPSWRRGSRSVRSSVKQKRRCRFALLLLLFFPSSSIVYRGGGGGTAGVRQLPSHLFLPFPYPPLFIYVFLLVAAKARNKRFHPFFLLIIVPLQQQQQEEETPLHWCYGIREAAPQAAASPFPQAVRAHTPHTRPQASTKPLPPLK